MGVCFSSPIPDDYPLTKSRSDWMGSLIKEEPVKFGNLKLFEILIPATHNSATYGVETIPFSSVAKCQKETIETQLASGIRLLDLRICDDTPDNILKISHRFLCGTLGEVFHQIYTFLKENTTEVVIVAIKKDWDRKLSAEGLCTVVKMIDNYFSNLLMTDDDVNKYGIKQLVELNKRILFISENLEDTRIPVSSLEQSWTSTNSVSTPKLFSKLDQYGHDNRDRLRAHDCYITPSGNEIAKWTAKGINWHRLQKDNNTALLDWLKERTQVSHDLNIIFCDMMSQDLVDFIIDSNPRKLS